MAAEAVAECLDEGCEAVDGKPGGFEVGRLPGEVDGGQLEQAEGVIGDDLLGRRGRDPLRKLGQLLPDGGFFLGRSWSTPTRGTVGAAGRAVSGRRPAVASGGGLERVRAGDLALARGRPKAAHGC